MVKFDVVIGNPPYQEDIEGTSAKQIYPLFMDAAYEVADISCLITPARFLFNAGKTSKVWNKKMLNDSHLKVVEYISDSSKVFGNTDIEGGVAITYRNDIDVVGPIGIFTSHESLNSIWVKVSEHYKGNIASISTIIHGPNRFDLDNLYSDYPEVKSRIGSNGKERRLTTPIFDSLSVLFSSTKTNKDYIGIMGRKDDKRVKKYIHRKYLSEHKNTCKWKVLVPQSNGSGALGEVLSTPLIGQPLIGQPFTGHTHTFLSIGSFEKEDEAEACMKYIKSKFARTLLGVLKVTQHNTRNTWKYVPLQDFTKDSDIDWTKSIKEIDQQLYEKYGLNEEEISFIETHVKEME